MPSVRYELTPQRRSGLACLAEGTASPRRLMPPGASSGVPSTSTPVARNSPPFAILPLEDADRRDRQHVRTGEVSGKGVRYPIGAGTPVNRFGPGSFTRLTQRGRLQRRVGPHRRHGS